MLDTIKNALTRTPRTLPLTQADKWLTPGRTKAKVQSLIAELDTALADLAHAWQVLGERMGDELDTTTAMEAMTQAESTVRMLEAALTVAKQKDAEAQRALTDAQRQASRAADDEVVAVLKASALKMETLLCGEMKLAADELNAALTAVKEQSGGDGEVRLA